VRIEAAGVIGAHDTQPWSDGPSAYCARVDKPTTAAAYLAAAPKDKRTALARLRRVIKAAAPKAREGLSYGIVVYKYEEKPLIYIGYAADHCAVYGYSSFIHAHPELFKDFKQTKGSVHFTPEHPIPDRTITRMVRAHMKEIDQRRATTYAKTKRVASASR
jgi:uncharacterized protein YdhG (YjbR/CyaY superfamily)